MHITCRIVTTFSYFKVYPSLYFIMLSSVKYRKHKVNFRTDATISLILYVHLSVCMEQSDSHWTDFHNISYSGVPNICQSILFWSKWTKITDTGHESLCVCGMISCCDDCFYNQDRLVLCEVQVESEEAVQHWASSTMDCEHMCCMLGTSWGWENGWTLCCKHNCFETSGVDIQGISLVNLPTYNVSVMASCKYVAKIGRNLIVCVKIFFWKVLTNETCRHSDKSDCLICVVLADIS